MGITKFNLKILRQPKMQQFKEFIEIEQKLVNFNERIKHKGFKPNKIQNIIQYQHLDFVYQSLVQLLQVHDYISLKNQVQQLLNLVNQNFQEEKIYSKPIDYNQLIQQEIQKSQNIQNTPHKQKFKFNLPQIENNDYFFKKNTSRSIQDKKTFQKYCNSYRNSKEFDIKIFGVKEKKYPSFLIPKPRKTELGIAIKTGKFAQNMQKTRRVSDITEQSQNKDSYSLF